MVCFILGIFDTVVVVGLVSVYIFHDVDQDKIGHWNAAFAEIFTEIVVFALIIGLPVWLLTSLGRYVLRLRGSAPRTRLAMFLGVSVTILQYPWEFAGRLFVPRLADSFLSVYLIGAIIVSTAVLIRESMFQLQAAQKAHGSTTSPE